MSLTRDVPDLIDPGRLRLAEVTGRAAAKPEQLPRHRPGDEFLKGPIPLNWLCQAARLPGKALAVGVALWFKAGAGRAASVRATGKLRERFGVSRKAGYRGLMALEHAGLIALERHRGRCPIATILNSPTINADDPESPVFDPKLPKRQP